MWETTLFLNVSLHLHFSVAFKPLKNGVILEQSGFPFFKINRRLFNDIWQKALFFLRLLCKPGSKLILNFGSIRSSISSVGSALDCRAGGCGFVSRDRGPILRVLKELRNECSVFALLTSKSSRGSVDHVKIGGHCRLPNQYFLANTLILK